MSVDPAKLLEDAVKAHKKVIEREPDVNETTEDRDAGNDGNE